MDDDERSEQVRGALLKVLGVIVVIAIVIFLGTTFLVKALGLALGGLRRAGRILGDHALAPAEQRAAAAG